MKTSLKSMNSVAGKKAKAGMPMKASLKNKNSTRGTSSDPKMKNRTSMNVPKAKGVSAKGNIHRNGSSTGGMKIKMGGGASTKPMRFSQAALANGAMKSPTGMAQPAAKKGKAVKSSFVGKKAVVKKTQS